MLCWPCCVMFMGTALAFCILVYAGLSLFVLSGPYLYMVVCVLYAYNLTIYFSTNERLFFGVIISKQNDIRRIPVA